MSCGCSPCATPLVTCVPPPVVVSFAVPGIIQYRLDITGWTGGNIDDLDSLEIASYPVGQLIAIQVGGAPNQLNIVQKVASTAPPVAEAIIRPVDYNVATNPYQWYVIS